MKVSTQIKAGVGPGCGCGGGGGVKLQPFHTHSK
jgi:hypothetical protein